MKKNRMELTPHELQALKDWCNFKSGKPMTRKEAFQELCGAVLFGLLFVALLFA